MNMKLKNKIAKIDINTHVEISLILSELQFRYDSTFIDKLKLEHEQLITMLKVFSNYSKLKKFNKISRLLALFKSKLQNNFINKGFRLHIYLRKANPNNILVKNILLNAKTETIKLHRILNLFLGFYVSCIWSNERKIQFELDLDEIRTRLENNFINEENILFPLYRPVEL